MLPAIAIIKIGYFSFTDVIFQHTDHKYFFISLIVLYPAIFLIQGVITAILKSNIFIPLVISILGFVITISLWANSSALGYVFVYILFALLGYGVTRLFQKRKRTN
ncbi:hypothetical protein F7731_15605 [Cytobacillus depressus]|uniref:DUF2651 domain-containing protein n=1 Tax=Cytobacillus depressus TaxID=1602942 RepID=A0A6L3V2Y9_9BACI|nr:hypothetical protein F7731_15605 [Cytobacillus depressus]